MKPILTGFAALMITAAPVLAESHMSSEGGMSGDETKNTETGANADNGMADTTANADSGMADNTASDEGAMGTHDSARTGTMDTADLIRTRDITGGTIYSLGETTGDWSADTEFDMVDNGWNDIGEIEDVVLNRDGALKGIVAEVGGFLDIADKHVMLEIDRMRLVPVDDRSFSVVTNMTEEELEQLESVDEGFWN